MLSSFTVVGFLLTIIFFGRQEYEAREINRQDAMAGTLSSSQDGLWTAVILGGGLPFAIRSADGILLRDGSTPLLSIEKDSKGKAVFSLDINSEVGNLIARLQDGEWSLQKASVFDRNYTHNLLEVEDVHGKIVLQAVNLGDALYVAGRFRCANGQFRWFERGPNGEGIWGPFGTNAVSPAYPIEPLCKYPSSLHLGECMNVSSVSGWKADDPNSKAYFVTGSQDICALPDQ